MMFRSKPNSKIERIRGGRMVLAVLFPMAVALWGKTERFALADSGLSEIGRTGRSECGVSTVGGWAARESVHQRSYARGGISVFRPRYCHGDESRFGAGPQRWNREDQHFRGGPEKSITVQVQNTEMPRPLHFENDIIPIFSRFGCNASGCHGKAEGQNGFKLSVFGFDPPADRRALVMEGRGRRVFRRLPHKVCCS